MIQLFGISLDTLSTVLLIITLVIIGGVLLLALSNLIFFKIGARNVPRRRTQMLLIVFALMLSTTLLSSVLAAGDVITGAVQGVAVTNLGNIDETISGGHGAIGYFPDEVYYNIVRQTRHNPDIAAVSDALIEVNILVADETSRQVRSKATILAVLPNTEQGFGGMQDVNSNRHLRIADLRPDEVYLNQTTAQLLNAHSGDSIYLYSQRWVGQRYAFRVRGIVANGGLVGNTPYVISPLQTFQQIEGHTDDITAIFIANRGGGGINGVDLSDRVTQTVQDLIPGDVHVSQVKKQGVQNSQKAQDIFTRIFVLFCLFALAIGLLLIFLIFVLLAAERRAEMGMARAIGVQRRHLILMFLFEGTLYDLIASLIGLAFGIGVGVALVIFLGPLLAQYGLPLKLTFQPHSLIIAYCLGVIFTFISVALSSWLVSRMTVVEALRDLPEPSQSNLSLGEVCVRLLTLLRLLFTRQTNRRGGGRANEGPGPLLTPTPTPLLATTPLLRRIKRILLEQIPDLLVQLIRSLILLGFVPLLLGYWLMSLGLQQALVSYFSLGLSLIVIGGGLLLKAGMELVVSMLQAVRTHSQRNAFFGKSAQRIFATLVGLGILAYWALPFDALARLGLPRFQGSIEVFFFAGLMMVLGAVFALIANADLLVIPLLAFCSRLPSLNILARLASAYPLHRRFRTGLSVVMFSLVVFAMTVMAVITNAMQNTYVNIDNQTGGYDIQGVAYFKGVPDLRSQLASHGINPNVFSAIGEQTSTQVGIVQLSADTPGWRYYPAQIVDGGFLQGLGVHLVARAQGFDSDAAVWQALQSHTSNYALIDSSALPYNPNAALSAVYDPNAPLPADAGSPTQPPGIDAYDAFSLSGAYVGDSTFPAAPVWVTTPQGPIASTSGAGFANVTFSTLKLTIIGVVDNSDYAHFGLYIPRAAYGQTDIAPHSVESQTYYFKVAPGQDKHALALALGSAFLDNGLETTVLEDAILLTRGPRILLSNVLLGIVGLALLLGVAALAITGTRAVVERRQQIGMLRAIGCKRRLIQGAFLFESFLVGFLGSILGVSLGLILCRNIFAVNFFEQFQTGLEFVVPWPEITLILGVALVASLLGALLPAWQAGRITPAEALRYQ